MGKSCIDFIGIGGMKCGSTWIADCLKEHPQICFPKHRKELHFFDEKFSFSSFYKNNPKNYRFETLGFDWYKSQFSHCVGVCGEFSTQYIIDPIACQRIKKVFPDVKIIAILRNPADRAFSEYLYNKRFGGQLKNISFEKAIENSWLLEKGLYAKHLKRYLDNFSKVKIMILEEVKKNPEKEIQSLYEFLGVSEDFVPSCLNKKINKRMMAKYSFINDIVNFGINFVIKNNLKFLFKIGTLLYLDVLVDGIRKKNVKELKFKLMHPETREKLVDFCREDVSDLENLLGKDLSFWLK